MRKYPILKNVSHALLARVLPLWGCFYLLLSAAPYQKTTIWFILLAIVGVTAMFSSFVKLYSRQLFLQYSGFMGWSVRTFMTETLPLCLLSSVISYNGLNYRAAFLFVITLYCLFNATGCLKDYFPNIYFKLIVIVKRFFQSNYDAKIEENENCRNVKSGLEMVYYETISNSIAQYEETGTENVMSVKIGVCHIIQDYLYYLASQCQFLEERESIYKLMPSSKSSDPDQALLLMLSIDKHQVALGRSVNSYYNFSTVTNAIVQFLRKN